MRKQIIAIGGALAKKPEGAPVMLEYIADQTGKERPRVLLINTATGDADTMRLWCYEIWSKLRKPCSISFLTFFHRTPPDLSALLLSQDIIFVNGGNTKSMLAVWREYGLDKILREAWEKGIILAGSSAGAICWFESCLTDSWDGSYTSLPCLGFLQGSCCPHYDGEEGRRETYHALVLSGELAGGLAIDECTAAHFVDSELHAVISGAADTAVYMVHAEGGEVSEERITGKLLQPA